MLVQGREVPLEAGPDELVERFLGQLELRAREGRAQHHEVRADPQQLGQERGPEPGGDVFERVERDDHREGLVCEWQRGAVGEQEATRVRAGDVTDHQLVLGEERLEWTRATTDLEDERPGRHREALEQLPGDLVALVLVERELEARVDGALRDAGLGHWCAGFTAPSHEPPRAITPCSSAGTPRSTSKRIVRCRKSKACEQE